MGFDYTFNFTEPMRSHILEDLAKYFSKDLYETFFLVNLGGKIISLGINYKQQESVSRYSTIDEVVYDLLLRAYPNRRFCSFIFLKIMMAKANSSIAT